MEEMRIHRVLFFLPVSLALFLLIVSLAHPAQVRAGAPRLDGGGLPTRTRTPTSPSAPLPPAETPTATQDSIFPATATMTQIPGANTNNQPLAPNTGLASEQTPGFSLLSCWPFALFVLLVLFVGGMWLRGRTRQSPT